MKYVPSVRRGGVTRWSAAAMAMTLTALAAAQTRSTTREPRRVDDLVGAFAKISARQQKAILKAVESAVWRVEDPYLAALRELAERGRKATKPRLKAPKTKSKGKRVATVHRWADALPFPIEFDYRFGVGVAKPISADGPRLSSRKRKAAEEALRTARLRAMLQGYTPDMDAVVAGILASLDTDASLARFAAFLDSWRDGDQPFYVALDRTAGTGKGVFYFDAMLADFVRAVLPRNHPEAKRLKKSLGAAQQAVHHGFLAYRQYRALREAIALSLVLPADVSLPEHLERYETKSPGCYSLRELFVMLLGTEGDDPRRLIERVAATAPALPDPLWSARYEPIGAIQELFKQRLDGMIDKWGHSDRLRDEQNRERAQLRDKIAEAARLAAIESLQ